MIIFKVGDYVLAKPALGGEDEDYMGGRIEYISMIEEPSIKVNFNNSTMIYWCYSTDVKKVNFNICDKVIAYCNNSRKEIGEVKAFKVDIGGTRCLVEFPGGWRHWNRLNDISLVKQDGNDIQQMTIDEGPFDKVTSNGEMVYISTGRGCSKTAEALKRFADEVHKNIDYTMKSTGNPYKDYLNRIYGFKSDDQLDALSEGLKKYIEADKRAMADFNKIKKENKKMKKQQRTRNRNIIKAKSDEQRKIREIMFNGPATIIKWDPTWHQYSNDIVGDKTVTVAKEPDKFDKTTGFLLAVLKEVLDNQSYGNVLEKIDEINKSDELSVEEDRDPKYDEHISKGTIALLNEAAEAMNSAFHIGSRVKYIHGKLVYRVVDCTYIPTKHEMYYTLSAYQNDILSGHETPKVYNVAHHRLKQIKRR